MRADCEHPGRDCQPNNCTDCGRFSAHSYTTGPFYTQDGFQEIWGGICGSCGPWQESAA